MIELLQRCKRQIELPQPVLEGRVTRVRGLVIEGLAKDASLGQLYRVKSREQELLAEVVALQDNQAVLMPFGDLGGLHVGAGLVPEGAASSVQVGAALLGRVIDPFGRPLDGGPSPETTGVRPLYSAPPGPMDRDPIAERLSLGVRSIDAFVPCGRGQRLGIFAGPGVGKSVLLGMIAKATEADVVVLALVGERNREVGHFVTQILGPEGLAKSIVVASTSDRPAPERVRAPLVATTIAEHFRDQGRSVLLFVDSLTRLCMAQREIGLAVGEPPTTKGYPPSSFARLAPLLERAAPANGGSITGLYSVLVEGDDMSDPVADTARGLLDGHIILSRRLAEQGHYPAMDVLQSVSRVANEVSTDVELKAARRLRQQMARIEEARDLVTIGAYKPGADPELDRALAMKKRIDGFLRQELTDRSALETTRRHLQELANQGSPS